MSKCSITIFRIPNSPKNPKTDNLTKGALQRPKERKKKSQFKPKLKKNYPNNSSISKKIEEWEYKKNMEKLRV